jgi:hypothetical protein
MGNLKSFGGSLTDSWHVDQVNLQKKILERMNELGINYVLPTFAGFVPDSINRQIRIFIFYKIKNFLIMFNNLGFTQIITLLHQKTGMVLAVILVGKKKNPHYFNKK